jgi:aminoglycoside 3-N-acetyltransferase
MKGLILKLIQIFISRGKYLTIKRKFQKISNSRFPSIDENKFKEILVNELNLKIGDSVFIHSSVDQLNINFEPTKILNFLLETVGENGTVLFPSWHFLNRAEVFFNGNPPDFNVLKTRSKLGFLSEWARMDKRSKRSLHPTNSIVAIGKDAEFYLSTHHNGIYPCGIDSPFYKLIEKRAKIIGLGVDVNNLTFLHCLEDVEPFLFPFRTRTEKLFDIQVINYDGEKKVIKTLLAHENIGNRNVIKFFKKHISSSKCLRFRLSGSSFFTTEAKSLNEELMVQAKKGNNIYNR